MHRRRSSMGALALALVLVAPLGASLPPFHEPEDQIPCRAPAVCPDLLVDAERMKDYDVVTRTFWERSCSVQEGHVTPGAHKLLRFTFTTPNVGQADLVIGRPADHPEWFEWGPCHGHWHFREYADYRLWTVDGYARWAAVRAALPLHTSEELLETFPELLEGYVKGEKRGFCVIDIVPFGPDVVADHVDRLLAPKFWNCYSDQGISVGWADEYSKFLDGQWVVVDGVPPGQYVLEAEVNAERLYEEVDYANNAAAVRVTIP